MWNKFRKRIKDYWSCIVIYFKELGRNKFFIVYLMCHQEKKSFRDQNWSFCWYDLQNTYPFQNVSIDGMVIPHIGRWKCKQYNPKNIKESHDSVKFEWWWNWLLLQCCYIYRYQNLLPCIFWKIQRDIWTSEKTRTKTAILFIDWFITAQST